MNYLKKHFQKKNTINQIKMNHKQSGLKKQATVKFNLNDANKSTFINPSPKSNKITESPPAASLTYEELHSRIHHQLGISRYLDHRGLIMFPHKQISDQSRSTGDYQNKKDNYRGLAS